MEGFARGMARILSDMSDGFGYSAMTEDGQITALKTLYPMVYGKNRRISAHFSKSVIQRFGEIHPTYKSAMFHGRTSTNKISLRNTHPMIRDGVHLMHNGVVDNHGEKYEKLTSNDSEDVLYHYLRGGITDVAKNLTGYYACGVLNPTDKTLTVFKDNLATLSYAWSDKLESYVFATTWNTIDQIGKYLQEELDPIVMDDNICVTLDKNEVIKAESFTPTQRYSKHAVESAGKSIGKSLSVVTTNKVMKYEDALSDDYLREIRSLDHTYRLEDPNGNEMLLSEFKDLKLAEKAQCTVIRHDGTIVDPWDYDMFEACGGNRS